MKREVLMAWSVSMAWLHGVECSVYPPCLHGVKCSVFMVLSVLPIHRAFMVWSIPSTHPAFMAKQGDNILGSVRPSVYLSVCLSKLLCLNRFTFDLDIYRSRSEGDNVIGSVRPSIRPFVFVCPSSPVWTVWPMTLIFGMGVDLDLG